MVWKVWRVLYQNTVTTTEATCMYALNYLSEHYSQYPKIRKQNKPFYSQPRMILKKSTKQ